MEKNTRVLKVVLNIEDAPKVGELSGEHYGDFDKVLTPAMRPLGGMLGVVRVRLLPGRVVCPFHRHQREI